MRFLDQRQRSITHGTAGSLSSAPASVHLVPSAPWEPCRGAWVNAADSKHTRTLCYWETLPLFSDIVPEIFSQIESRTKTASAANDAKIWETVGKLVFSCSLLILMQTLYSISWNNHFNNFSEIYIYLYIYTHTHTQGWCSRCCVCVCIHMSDFLISIDKFEPTKY